MPKSQAIETTYAGCRFRSRLEARWAVFFDALGAAWEYEPEGFRLPSGKWYLPDFRLPDCGTWIEVKGRDEDLDREMLMEAAEALPFMPGKGEPGPRLMLLGPMPRPIARHLDYSWGGWGFGSYRKNLRPWWLDGPAEFSVVPTVVPETGCPEAYAAARAKRFEHEEREQW